MASKNVAFETEEAAKAFLFIWTAWVVVSLALYFVAIPAFPIAALFGGICIVVAWLALAAWSLVGTVRLLVGRKWLSGAACLVTPFALPLIMYWIVPYAQRPVDYLHFVAMRPAYDATIARLPKNGHRFAEFNWGGWTFASEGIVYDETDEVALPSGRQSADWKRRMRDTDLTCGGEGPIGEVTPMGDHYYLTMFGC